LYRPQMAPDRSIYDLFKVVFARSGVMLREHFRCVAPIIEYSKREFYSHELRPLRIPKSSERLDPPLIDVFIEDGYRNGNINRPEAEFIVREIERLTDDPTMSRRSIGVVSLLADEQAGHIFERLTQEIGPEIMDRHRIACGDARTFQGKERDIMFLSMVTASNERTIALTTAMFQQRFNVAASRARDRMYLVRSIEIDELSPADILRRGLLTHFKTPFLQDEEEVVDLRKKCESDFEREVFDELSQRGYRLKPQVRAGQYRIDLVVEGHGDARLAIECDGDRYHGSDKWAEDQNRQRVLERAGWVFWRCFASTYTRRKQTVLADLLRTLTERGIEPTGGEGAPRSLHTALRKWRAATAAPQDEDANLKEQTADTDPRGAAASESAIESPMPREAKTEETQMAPAGRRSQSSRENRAPPPYLPALKFLARTREGSPTSHATSISDLSFSDEALAAFCQRHGLHTSDKRRVGGALWVDHLGPRGAVAAQLREWGFRLKPGKGYWRT
jgi:very-short-patch-repair endonuclease